MPAPDEAGHDEALMLPGRLECATPQALRAACRERYGWHDDCDNCGVPARECGHRRPES